MKSGHVIKTLIVAFLLSSIIVLTLGGNSGAVSEKEYKTLSLFFGKEELVVSPSRYAKPVSKTAENVTVITAKEIEMMNAHTLADVLYSVPGVEVDVTGGPGSASPVFIQGSEFRHVLVLVDGVEWNNLSDGFADVGAIPVQNIEKIEIIKGPASSSWGSSLGGVINVITKSPPASEKTGGTLSASYGEKNTGDYRAEVSGGVKNLGYYFYAGNLVTKGMGPNTHFRENSIYTKLRWDINDKAGLLWTFGYDKAPRGSGEAPDENLAFDNGVEYLFSTLALNYRISRNADVDVSLRTIRRNTKQSVKTLDSGEVLSESTADDRNYGGSIKLDLKNDMNHAVFGLDYDNGELRSDAVLDGEQKLDQWAVFANDTLSLGRFSLIPGLRYDHTNTNGDFVSPSLGVTYRLGEMTVIRGYVARGFSIPPLGDTFATSFFTVPNPGLKMEKVWSYQVGAESTALEYLWMKATLFRHDVEDAIVSEELPDGTFTEVNGAKQRRQGIEVEVRTIPVYHTSFSAGFVFIDAKDRKTGETLKDIPRYTYDVGVRYNDDRTFSALLKGHYIWWNNGPGLGGQYNAFIWDLNLDKGVYAEDGRRVELYFAVHNIFDGSQYVISEYENPRRWVEAGARFTF